MNQFNLKNSFFFYLYFFLYMLRSESVYNQMQQDTLTGGF